MTVAHATESAVLDRIQQRVLWLAMQQVHHANHVRERKDDLKVGGHQASCASVVTLMTTLYFRFMRAGDLIAVKPHASPVFHAIQYLLGNLDEDYLRRLREFGGLQAYPSRRRDPDSVDFSTGSVGLGAVAPNFAATVDTYLRTHQFGIADRDRRFISLVGDAELDEGSVWEAIAERSMSDAAKTLWIVDLNRQSLDRAIPGIRVRCWREMFAANGWDVIDAKYGRLLQGAFDEPNGELLRICIDELSNDAYQRLLRLPAADLREWLPRKSRYGNDLKRLLDRWDDGQLYDIFWNLGGHDLDVLQAALAKSTRTTQPSVIFAYTLKGWRLPSMGHPQNHAVMLSADQMATLRQSLEISPDDQWARFDETSPEGECCRTTAERLFAAEPATPQPTTHVPADVPLTFKGMRTTQQVFGTILSKLSRVFPEVAERVVTVSPDVASSTNLGGWINKRQVWQLGEQEELPREQVEGVLQWTSSPAGQHIELGISESNLFLMLGQLGLAHELFGQTLLPIGTLYDPFVRRGLDALFYSIYSGAKMIVVGTPSGVTLAAEGGMHQSIMTSSIGVEMPELVAYEPCFGQELNWIMMDALRRVASRESSTYLRLTTKRMDQDLFPQPADESDRERLRQAVLAGAYRLRDCRQDVGYAPGTNVVHLFAAGAMVAEALTAHDCLREQGIHANVFNVTGPGPLYHDFQNASAATVAGQSQESWVSQLVPSEERSAPFVTLVDAHPHSLAWIGSALGTNVWPLGVGDFGQSGSLSDVYQAYQIDVDHICTTCQSAISTDRRLSVGESRD